MSSSLISAGKMVWKTLPLKEDENKRSYQRYENTIYPSNKFWQIYFNKTGSEVITEYGKIGGTINKSVKKFKNSWEANSFYDSKIKEKVKKGYTLVSETPKLKTINERNI